PDAAWLQAAAGIRAVADREHRSGSIRSFGNADYRLKRRDWLRRVDPFQNGGPATSLFLADRSVLGDLGDGRISRHVGSLASGAGSRSLLCHPAVPGFELPWPLAGGHCGLALVDGGFDCAASILEAA